MNTLNDALKPCPFCGNAVEESRDCAGFYNYHCTNRKCKCSLYGDYEHHMTGRKAWNTRANTPESSAAQGAMTPKRAEFLKWLKDTHNIVPEQAMTESNAYRIAADYLEKVAGEEGFYADHAMTLADGIKSLRNAAQPSDATAQPSDQEKVWLLTHSIDDSLTRYCHDKGSLDQYTKHGEWIISATYGLLANTAQGKPTIAADLPEVECPDCGLKVMSSCGNKCPVPDAYALAAKKG